jgi:sulfate adenylyltransferase
MAGLSFCFTEENMSTVTARRQEKREIPGPSLPHGGRLVDRWVPREQAAELRARAEMLPAVRVSPSLRSDLELLASGAYSPLSGFLGTRDLMTVLEDMRLADGTVWPLPIVLPVKGSVARSLRPGQDVALRSGSEVVGILELQEVFPYDKELFARRVYGTTDPEHPGVLRVLGQGDYLLAGPVRVLPRRSSRRFHGYHLTPLETRKIFAERGWRTVVGFQTRNPIHRAHEFIQKSALEIVDGLLVHPLVGETKPDDIAPGVRMRCYEALLQAYYPRDRTLLAVFPAYMRYAGPREAVFHALVRKNYGCTHFIVGRDHAGVGNYYGPYDAQEIFRRFRPEELGVTPLFFENAFYCRACQGMASGKTCPHPEELRLTLSGTRLREMLRRGELPPPEFTRPEVARILVEAMSGRRGRSNNGRKGRGKTS